ncbi:hypothetical protein [Burkholderia ubonensis]|uniref:hypothetical protein n=1 Tax=Burkholderia ubonensis TaxID=101571 RepID=UPI000AE3FD70|nr:hypothetical protein [Burkholderia ubonensis]
MNNKIVGGCAVSLALLAGCTDLVISNLSPAPYADGFVYSLPMGQIYVQAARSQVTADDVNKAKAAFDAAQKAITKDKSDLTAAQNAKDATKTASVQAQLQLDQAAVKQAQATQSSLKVGDWNETVSLALAPQAVVADPNARYIGNLNHNWTRDDNLKLSIVNGLLNTSTVTSTDQTPNIVITLADTAITFATGVGLHPVPSPQVKAETTCDAFSLASMFDPLDATALRKVNDQLSAKHASFRIDVSPTPTERTNAHSVSPTQISGLAYRTAMPVVIAIVKIDPSAMNQANPPNQGAPAIPAAPAAGVSTPAANEPPKPAPVPDANGQPDPNHAPGAGPAAPVKQAQKAGVKKDVNNETSPSATGVCKLASSPPAQELQTIMPDSRTQYVVTSKAGAFTTTTLTFGFSNGMLTDYSMQRPSEIAAVAGIPVRIANDIMTIPTQLLQLRVNQDTAAVAKVNGDAAVKAAQIQQAATLSNAETAVVNAQTALATARIGSPTSIANAQTGLVNALDQLRAARAKAASNSAAASSP